MHRRHFLGALSAGVLAPAAPQVFAANATAEPARTSGRLVPIPWWSSNWRCVNSTKSTSAAVNLDGHRRHAQAQIGLDVQKEITIMSHVNIIRAWKDPWYRLSMSTADQALLPTHTVGLIEHKLMRLNHLKGNLRFLNACGAFAIVLGLLFGQPVWADDGKAYPGTMCKEAVDGYHILRASGDVVYDGDGNALSVSTGSTRYVTCPLIRDSERPQGQISYVAVSYYKAGSAGLACTIVSNPYFGGTGWSFTQWDFSPGNSKLRLMELPSQADTFTSGSYYLFCILPPTTSSNGKPDKTGIAHYGIVERE